MSRPVWEDITSYSRDDRERIPSTWELRLTREVRIVVTRGHIYDRENWVMHCAPWFDTHSLKLPSTVDNRDEAMARATALVRDKFAALAAALREVN